MGNWNAEFISIYKKNLVKNNIHTKHVTMVIFHLLMFSKMHDLAINKIC